MCKTASVLCNSPECAFYETGTPHNCGLPQYLKDKFRLSAAEKVRDAVENCHCHNPALLDAYERACRTT